MPRISVIMPTYNASRYIKEAIESILNQTFQDFELLIIDDNSTDDTINIINTFNNPKIRIIKGDCKGIAAALNKGLREARGEYIARMDADDISLLERFEKQITFLDQNPKIGILGTKATAFFEDGRTCDWGNIQPFPTDIDMLFECVVCHPTVMFRKSILEKYRLEYNQEMRWAEDQELWFRALNVTNFANIMEPLHKYRVIEQNASTKYKNVGDEFVWGLRKEIFEKYFPNNNTNHETIKPTIKKLKKLIEKSNIPTHKIPFQVHWTGKEFKEIIPVFYSSSPEMFPIMSASLTSVVMNTKNYIKFFILQRNDCNYNEKEVRALEKLQNKCKNFEINYIKVDNNKFLNFNLPKSNYITMETYFRYLLPNIDLNIDKAIYLDCDTICLKDITELYKEDIGEHLLGATCQEKGSYMTPDMSKIIAKTGIKDPYSYFNAGVLVFNCKKFREKNITPELFNTTNKLIDKIEYADQDVLNIVCENRYKELENKYNYYSFRINNIKDVNIIHFVGIEKPWNTQCPYDNYFWKYAFMLPYWNNSKTRKKLIKRFIKNIGEGLFSLKNQNTHKIIKIAGIKFKVKSAKNLQKKNLEDIKSTLYEIATTTNELKIELEKARKEISFYGTKTLVNWEVISRDKKCLFINDTSDDFHHGSCATSSAIIKRLKNHFTNVETISINEIRSMNLIPQNHQEFIDDDYFEHWRNTHAELFEKINKHDIIIVNGEGCLSYYKWNRQFAYLTYIASKYLNKYVALINTSIFNTECNEHEYDDWAKIIGTTLDNCNFVAVREPQSLIDCSDFSTNPLMLTFDCLPLYIDEDFIYTKPQITNYILISGGNNIPQNYDEVIYNFIHENHLKNKNMYFLYSNVKTCSEGSGDIKLFNKLKEKFEGLKLIEANTIDEWLSYIKAADIFISGRFHHSIAAFMFNTPFIAVPTDTPKLKSLLKMLNCENNLIKNNTSIKCPTKHNNSLQAKILTLAKRNFEFLNTHYETKELNTTKRMAQL